MNYNILLTIDVEDWFQVENFKKWIPYSTWSSRELRVEKNTHRLLDLLDSTTCGEPVTLRQRRGELSQFHPRFQRDRQETEKTKKSSQSCISCLPRRSGRSYWGQKKTNTPKATFFVLGWLAKRLPHLVREIHSRGHEVASHGYHHDLWYKQAYQDLKKDLSDSKKLLEDILGEQVRGCRAPNFSINDDILKIIQECGYLYDSSYNSFAMHGRYGKISLNGKSRVGIAYRINSDFYELPISNLKFNIQYLELPWGGGGYFRLIPYPIFKAGVQTILKNKNAYLLFLHPWEVDPNQPRVNKASAGYKFRHYVNLNKTLSKLSSLINDFSHVNFITCRQYIEKIIT